MSKIKMKYESREQNILKSARRIIMHEGISELRMPELAVTADVAVGTLYRHFESRSDVIAGLAEQALLARYKKLAYVLENFDDPSDRMIATPLLDFVFNVVNVEAFSIEIMCALPSFWQEASDFRKDKFTSIATALEALLKELMTGVSCENASVVTISQGVWGLVNGQTLVWLNQSNTETPNLKAAMAFFQPHLISFFTGHYENFKSDLEQLSRLEKWIISNENKWLWHDEGENG